MNISITFRQMEATEAVKSYATEKVSKLQRLLRSPMKAQVTLATQHRAHTAEVDIHSGSEHLHARETSEDMYATIDKVTDKLERQIRANHESKTNKKGQERASERLIVGAAEDED
jgi:putative sigma-54 modulation protein